MVDARITIDRDFTAGPLSRRLFGSFIEHMGRSIYTGVYEPGHHTSDQHGFRGDVLDLTRELGVSVIRYPGGNFVSGYNWEDGVGPRHSRPCRLDIAWRSVETNEFGLHEFVRWADLAETEVMEAVNLGTRGADEARALVEYANHPKGTYLSDLRRQHGAEEPFGIKLWALGNEMDGQWQIGHKEAADYGRLAFQSARAMRAVDPNIELIVCGSSKASMPGFGEWERTVLSHTLDEVDYVSLHAYYSQGDGAIGCFLASSVHFDFSIEAVAASADSVSAKTMLRKKVALAIDEWNVTHGHSADIEEKRRATLTKSWPQHPAIGEFYYNVTEAVVVGTLLNSLLRHGDRVKIANQAQLVNVLGLIGTSPGGNAWRQSSFFPFAEMARCASGLILRLASTSDQYESRLYGDVDFVDASGTWDEDRGQVALFIANRSLHDRARIEVTTRGLHPEKTLIARVLTVPPAMNRNNVNNATSQPIQMRPLDSVLIDEGRVFVDLPSLCWATVTFTVSVIR